MSPLPPTRERPIVFVSPAFGTPGDQDGSSGPPPKRSMWRRVGRALGFISAIALAVGLGVFASATYFTQQKVNELVKPRTADTVKAQRHLAQPLPGKPANVLLLGSDHRGADAANDRRSDTIMLMRLDPQGKTISMLSFPRDLYVTIPGRGQDRINAAYSYGGSALSIETIKQLTGLDINYVVNVDFRGFRDVITTLGGVYADVDRRYYNPEGTGYSAIDIQPGYQLLRGRDALAYSRVRHTDSDFHRMARQQLMITAVRKQIGASRVASNIPGLYRVLYRNTDMAAGGNGKVSARAVIDYMRLAMSLKAHSIYQFQVDGGIGTTGAGASIVEADESKIKAQVDAFLHPDEQAQGESADQLVGKQDADGAAPTAAPAEPKLPPASSVTVTVLNGNGVTGAAGTAGAALRTLGYRVTVPSGEAGSADNMSYATTRVQYRSETDRALAERLATSIPGSTVEPAPGRINPFQTRLLVIVGRSGTVRTGSMASQDATTSTQSAENNRVQPRQKANVIRDAEYGLDDFRAIRGQQRFPLLYPTVRETSSTYSSDGVRAYKIRKGRTTYGAYRLVASTASGDYWGIQGTAWPDPPVIEDPTRTVQRGGRTYMLFFNGTKLHMVAWREGGGTYWVTNSLLNKLSNETMLAIAEGVRRVPRR